MNSPCAHMTFFCVEYGEHPSAEDARYVISIDEIIGNPVNEEFKEFYRYKILWEFSDKRFNESRIEIECITNWEYRGGTELILANAKYDSEKKEAYIDFNEAINLDLDDAKKEGSIDSIEKFFESIFRYAEKQSGEDPLWGFRKKIISKSISSVLKELVLSLLPKGIGQSIKKSSFSLMKSINQKAV
jgi:hypothetical protein